MVFLEIREMKEEGKCKSLWFFAIILWVLANLFWSDNIANRIESIDSNNMDSDAVFNWYYTRELRVNIGN